MTGATAGRPGSITSQRAGWKIRTPASRADSNSAVSSACRETPHMGRGNAIRHDEPFAA